MKKLEFLLGLPKTLYFNFKHFDFTVAVKLPVLISHRVSILGIRNGISINAPINFGMINIGFTNTDVFAKNTNSTILICNGKIVFYGTANIGSGCEICVEKSGTIEFGSNFYLTGRSQIMCSKHIKFGNNTIISWDCLIMDTDFHQILRVGKVSNDNKEIVIGDKVWIGCRSTILKGCVISANNIVASNSLVTGDFKEEHCIIAGNPARTIENNIDWLN